MSLRQPLCAWLLIDPDGRKHILAHHRRKPSWHQCRRCKQQFDNETMLEEHLLVPRDQICEASPAKSDDPEDGITDDAASIAAAKETTTETWTWEALWRFVFPGDSDVPDPGMPLSSSDRSHTRLTRR